MVRWYHWLLLALFMSVAAGITFYAAAHDQYDPATKHLRTGFCLLLTESQAVFGWAMGVLMESLMRNRKKES